jgi:hypothetical protein
MFSLYSCIQNSKKYTQIWQQSLKPRASQRRALSLALLTTTLAGQFATDINFYCFGFQNSFELSRPVNFRDLQDFTVTNNSGREKKNLGKSRNFR